MRVDQNYFSSISFYNKTSQKKITYSSNLCILQKLELRSSFSDKIHICTHLKKSQRMVPKCLRHLKKSKLS